MSRLPVMESFLTIQGEGFHSGSLAYFIRLSGCDVGCSWCDVKDSWPIHEDQWVSVEQLAVEAKDSGAEIDVITGGEPLMHDLTELTVKLRDNNQIIHLETSGAHPLSGDIDWITLSPKKFKEALPSIYKLASELKVVIVNKMDLDWAKLESEKVHSDCLLFLQAEWDKKEKIYPLIYSYIVVNPDWKISVQSHKYLGLP